MQKGVYPYGYTNDLEKFNETSLPKKDFYSCLNMEDITHADYAHAKRVCNGFEVKPLGQHHNLYVKRDALFLAYVFGNFRNIWSWSSKISFSIWISIASSIKNTKGKLDLLNDIDMLLMVEKSFTG